MCTEYHDVELNESMAYIALRDIVSYAVICRVCPRHGMQIHIQTCTWCGPIYILVPRYVTVQCSVQMGIVGAKYRVRTAPISRAAL